VVDKEKCVDCGLCEKVCPELHAEELKVNDFNEPECYAAIHKNLEIRFDSTSGGMFTALADLMYSQGGYVGGAVYTETWGVRLFISNNKDDLIKLRSSKYLQSNAEGIYKQVKELLIRGEKVLMCGLPCQIAALKAFLHKDYENLITVDLICRYINSPFAYRKYLDSLEKQYGGKVVYIKAKNKELGWRNLTHKVIFDNDSTYYGTAKDDIFMKASMFLNCVSRPACYSCSFKGFPRIPDITIGDYWTAANKSTLDDNTGTSIVLINSVKGQKFFEQVSKKLKKEKVSLPQVTEKNPALISSLPMYHVDRDTFFKRLYNEDFTDVVNSMIQHRTYYKLVVKNYIDIWKAALKKSQYKLRPFIQFIHLNFFHPAVKSDISKGHVIYPTPYCLFEIDKEAKIILNGSLIVGGSPFRNSKLETRIRMEKDAVLDIRGDYAFGYGSDVEIFKGAELISKGGPSTNMGATIICKKKIVIGRAVAIGRNVTIRDNNGGHLISVNGYVDSKPIIIGEHAWLCSGVTVMSGVKIGDGTIVSAGVLVTHSFPARVVVSGFPAQITQRNIYWKM
jgi:acetyltransferase-like isoleucine patch superfamily enzyme/coenzyme F420-reducing hydrogenase beta subunit